MASLYPFGVSIPGLCLQVLELSLMVLILCCLSITLLKLGGRGEGDGRGSKAIRWARCWI